MAYRFARTYPQLGIGDCGGNGSMATCCDSCAHGGSCGRGLGLFDSGWDISTWGWQEWAIVALGGYMLFSTVSTTGRAARGLAAIPAKRRRRIAANRRLREVT